MRTAEVETVHYRTDEMIAASDELIANYARYSGIEGTESWPSALIAVRHIINGQLPQSFEWKTPAINLTFSGFPRALPQLIEGDLKYVADPPHFILEEGIAYDLLNRRVKTRIERTNMQIIEAVSEAHKLNIQWRNPELVLEFPKEQYAENIDISTGVILR